jgi:urea carboxylase
MVSVMSRAPVTRYQLRERCAELGVAFGRIGQWQRRIGVVVRAQAPAADRELTFTQGTHDAVLSISPALLTADIRAELYQTAHRLIGEFLTDQAYEIIFLLHDDDIAVEEIVPWTAAEPIFTAADPVHVTTRICASSAGRIISVQVPADAGAAINALVEVGDSVSVGARLISVSHSAATHDEALPLAHRSIAACSIYGVNTDQRRVLALLAQPSLRDGSASAALVGISCPPADITIITPGIQSTLQDFPGRIGYWAVGIPPSGPMDDLGLRLGNQVLGNPSDAVGIEITLGGFAVRFAKATHIALTGAVATATCNGQPLSWWKAQEIPAGAEVKLGALTGKGVRSYLCVRGGIDAPRYLGSRSTFTLGGFGGHAGRELRAGDELQVQAPSGALSELLPAHVPRYERVWRIGVLYGPHAAPDFFTPADIREFFAATWTVSPQSNRTGVRLIGPKPRWARADGGEAGLHPSNIHDNAYALGAIDFTGDMPVILGPDGPSLGGFVCPAVVAQAERWKLGQLKPGDQVRFVRLDRATARSQATTPGQLISTTIKSEEDAILQRIKATDSTPAVCYRRAGDDYILIEYGPLVLHFDLRMRVHVLQERVAALKHPAILDLTAGIRSLQIHFDPRLIDEDALLRLLMSLENELPRGDNITVPSRVVHLPLSWDDPATRKAIDIYTRTVRKDAPWCPSNLEFIRRINGLNSIDDVQRIVFDAEYLVLGLGDVYLGAPVATPVDPRHRLVTTKYNPARTWTPENAVGIGGAYMCIYGMEGPGGYQFVGRTVQVWNSWRTTAHFSAEKPWLLRPFDRIRFFPVSAEELLRMREDFPRGKLPIKIDDGEFSLAHHHQFLHRHADDIAAFTKQRQTAFAAERARWQQAGSGA